MEFSQRQSIDTTELTSYYSSSLSLSKAKKDPTQVASEFEAIFYRMILREMRKSTLDASIFEGPSTQSYLEMVDNEMSSLLGRQGHLGISKMILDHLESIESAPQQQDTSKKMQKGLLK